MPRYLVKEQRAYTEAWLIDARSPEEAKAQHGEIIDRSESESWGESAEVDEVDFDMDEVEL